VHRGLAAIAALAVLAGCAGRGGALPSQRTSPASVSPSTTPSSGYASTVEPLPDALTARMTGVSWRPGCPVPLSALRLVRVTYLGFDGQPHQGELVANADVSDQLVRIFQRVYEARFPIRKMVPVDAYDGSDDRSMADDNTSMFNCRTVLGTTRWSVHAYGRAVDVNTVENPYRPDRATVLPPAGRAYLDRNDARPGMLRAGDAVVRAFESEGFVWGGRWSPPDYQHFQIG